MPPDSNPISEKTQNNSENLLKKFSEAITLTIPAFIVFLSTQHIIPQSLLLPLLFGYFVILCFITFFSNKTDLYNAPSIHSPVVRVILFSCIALIMWLVGSSGWFTSPYFYLLYLVGVSLGFLMNASVFFAFVLSSSLVLLPQIRILNIPADLTSVVALIFIVPLSYLLKKEYLKRIENENQILVLKHQNHIYKTTLDEVLSNKVTLVATDLRQRLNDIHSYTLYLKNHPFKINTEAILKFEDISLDAIEIINKFEETSTGKKLAKSTHSL